MNNLLKKRWLIPLLGITIILLVVRHFYSYHESKQNIVENISPLFLDGEVELISLNRGLKIKFKGDKNFYYMSGYCEDTLCLSDAVQIGDSIKKDKSSKIIYLKSMRTGIKTEWMLK